MGRSLIAVELRHLRYFVALSEELHFGRAARRLHMSQPPLSKAIRKLEDELGVVLIDRTRRAISLTEAGRVFAEEARDVLSVFGRAVAETRRAAGLGSVLRVGSSPILPIERVARFLDALRRQVPDSPAEIAHLVAEEQASRLRAGELDLGIFWYAKDHDDLRLEPLFGGEHLAAVLAPDHPLAVRDVLRPDDLRGQTLVTLSPDLNRTLYERVLADLETAGYRFGGVRTVGGLNIRDLLLAVAAEGGVGFISVSERELGEEGSIVIRRPIDPPVTMPPTVVAWRAHAPQHLRRVLAEVRRVTQDLRRADASDPHHTAIGGARMDIGRAHPASG